MEHLRVTVEEDAPSDCRLDRYITENLDLLTRSQLKARAGRVTVNGRPGKLSRRVAPGDVLEVEYSAPEAMTLRPEPMDLRIVFEDGRVIVINKEQGRVVHPGVGNWTGTLVAGVLAHCAEVGDRFGPQDVRPGIVHRLDKDTSGVIVVAKSPEIHQELSDQFRDRRVGKVYYAIVCGAPPSPDGTVDVPIGRDPNHRQRFLARPGMSIQEAGIRFARTDYRVVARWTGYSLVRFVPLTGRTHQLRVHAVWLGCPILGDPIYGRRDHAFPDATLMLHAYALSIRLPGEETRRRFHAPLGVRFARVMALLSGPPE